MIRTLLYRSCLALVLLLLAFLPLDAQSVTRFTGGLKADSMSAEVVIPITVGTAANAQALEFEAPWNMKLELVSARAGAVTNPGDGDVTVDVQDDGVSVLSAPLSFAAAATTYEESLSSTIAAGSVVKVLFALSGTSPALSNVVVAITGRRALN